MPIKNSQIEPDVIFIDENTFYIQNPVTTKGTPLLFESKKIRRIYFSSPELSVIGDLSIADIGRGHIDTVLILLERTSKPSIPLSVFAELRLDCIVLLSAGLKQFFIGEDTPDE